MAKPRGFNEYLAGKDEEHLRPRVQILDPKTLEALQELASIMTWDQFVKICETQRKKSR